MTPDDAAPDRPNSYPRFATVLTGVAIVLFGLLIYWPFVFGTSLLLYKDAGADSLNDYYPWFVHLSDYIRKEGFPSWSFYVGMGQDISVFLNYLILEPVSWLPKDAIAHALIYQHLAKVIITGLSFFLFLKLLRLPLVAAFAGSLLVPFSAYMCMGGAWYPFADHVLCFTLLLLAVEVAFTARRWLLLTIAVALIGVIDPFHLYLGALFLLLYVPSRFYLRHGWQPKRILKHCFGLAATSLLGAALAAVVVIPALHGILNSPRLAKETSYVGSLVSQSVFSFESVLHGMTAALRVYSNDIMGTAEGFRGWYNYLEAPLSYCGLLCLLLVPQSFIGRARREKVVFGLFLGGILVCTVFPWFRHLFWLFQGDYYRTFSLFSILGIVTLAMIALSGYIRGRLNVWLLGGTALVVVGFLYLPLAGMQSRIDSSLRFQATIFLVLLTVILLAGHGVRKPQLFSWMAVAVTACELFLFDRITVSRRSTVQKEELKARTGYNDLTVDALSDIKAIDKSPFYRLTKTWPSAPGVSPSLNDAMIFGYYGTSAYTSFNSIDYVRFLIGVDAIRPKSENDTRWSLGLLNESTLSLFAGEKYALTREPAPYQRALQYELVRNYDDAFLFRNARSLPLGLSFDRYLREESFLNLPTSEKADVLLQTAVLAAEADPQKIGIVEATVADLEDELRRASVLDIAETRRSHALELTSFSQSHITGSLSLERRSLLILQTPFSKGWKAWQDGQPMPVVRADMGLLGVAVDAGRHQIEFRYRTPFLFLGAGISAMALLVLLFARLRWPRLPEPNA